MLELIHRGAGTASHPVPVLFVHGGFHGAWCWDDHFLGHFADAGFHAAAVSLRAHGGSVTSQPLRSCSIRDYLDDVTEAIRRLEGPVVLIGHSMGGFLVQSYLRNQVLPAAVLLASVPPRGVLHAAGRVFRRYPLGALKANRWGGSDLVGTPRMARHLLFSPDTPESTVQACVERAQPESLRASFFDLLVHPLATPATIDTPLLVLGAECDGFVTPVEVAQTAAAYGAEPEMFPGMGHNMMCEPGWRDVADRIITWLAERGL